MSRPLVDVLERRVESLSARQHELARERAIVEDALRRLRCGADEWVVSVEIEQKVARW